MSKFVAGTKVYMPLLGDTPRDWMVFIGENGEFAVLAYPSGTETQYPLRYVEPIPPSYEVEFTVLILSIVAALFAATIYWG